MGEIERYEKCYMGFFSKHLSFIRFNGGKISASNDWDVVFKLKTFVQAEVNQNSFWYANRDSFRHELKDSSIWHFPNNSVLILRNFWLVLC